MKSPSLFSSSSLYKNQMPFPFNPNITISYDSAKINNSSGSSSKYVSTTDSSSNSKEKTNSISIPHEMTAQIEALDLKNNTSEIDLKNGNLNIED